MNRQINNECLVMKTPASWQRERLEKLVQFSSGGTPSKSKSEFWRGDIPWISAATMHQQEIVKSNLNISKDGLESGSKLAKENDLLLLVRGSMLWKKVPICICKRDVAFNQDVKALRIRGKTTPTYLLYWFLAHQRFLLNKVVGTGIGAGKLDFDELKALEILLPPLPEQKAIADLLSTWDEAIEKTERLVKAKEKRFKWLLRELISEPRNTRKDTEWKKVKLGEVGNPYSGLTGKNKDDFGTGKPYLPYLNVYQNFQINTKQIDYVNIQEREKQKLVQKGDVFFTVSSETPDEVGISSVLMDDVGECYLNSFCFGWRPSSNELLPAYLRFYFRSLVFREQMNRLAQGATRFNLSKTELMKAYILYPSFMEQQRIAEKLSSFQQEIEQLKQLADKYKTLKRGLMQKMLTGEWRLNGFAE